MRFSAKWFSSATMMAFLALVALFISPVLALGCCCQSGAPHHLAAKRAAQQTQHACCAHSVASHFTPNATFSSVCNCQDNWQNAPFIASDASRFVVFAPVALWLAPQKPVLLPQQEAEVSRFFVFGARPRSPDRNAALGRAPPALL